MKKAMTAKNKLFRMILTAMMLLTLVTALMPSPAAAVSVTVGTPILSAAELFSDRDLRQTADTGSAVSYTVSDGSDIRITQDGVYLLTGSARNVTVYVEAGEADKVQLVLDGLSITNDDFPCIYIKTADKVFVTAASDSTLTVTGTFRSDGDTRTDGVIFSRQDLVLNGEASLTVTSSDNGIVCKDDLKITGGTCDVTAKAKAIEANDSIRIAGGTLILNAGTDGLHAENSDDDTLGYIFIANGSLQITAGDDGIHAVSFIQIDGGSLSLKAAEGIEATYIQLNGGSISIQASDDGINAARKSAGYRPTVEINGGDITISMGQGDTDGIDSNGDIYVTGGTVNVTGNSSFDYDGTATWTGGTIIVNGRQVSSIPNQMMGGGGWGTRDSWGSQNGWDGQSGWGSQGGRGSQGRDSRNDWGSRNSQEGQESPDAQSGPTGQGRPGGW